jgi:hypothetical protein
MSSFVIVCRRTDKPAVRPWFTCETEEEWIDRDPGHGWPPKNERYQDRQDAKRSVAKLREHMLPIFDFTIVPVTKGMREELRVGVKFA